MEDWIAGADGCRGGWFCIARNLKSGELRYSICATASALLAQKPAARILCIDIPIGLPAGGDRACDKAARKLLGWPRMASVFSAPPRDTLNARTHDEASRISAAIDGRKMSAQTWNLIPKIRDVDRLVLDLTSDQSTVFEVHPEVSFWAWSGGLGMQHQKKTPLGHAERRLLISKWLGENFWPDARTGFLKKHVANDDILDAAAALWTANRIHQSNAKYLDGSQPRDAAGVHMRIAY